MAENPQLFGNGMPVPFHGEMFVLARDGVEFHVDKIPSCVIPSLSSVLSPRLLSPRLDRLLFFFPI